MLISRLISPDEQSGSLEKMGPTNMECLVLQKGLCRQALCNFFQSNRILYLLTKSWANPLMINWVLMGGIFSTSRGHGTIHTPWWNLLQLPSNKPWEELVVRPRSPAFFPLIGMPSSAASFDATPWKASREVFYQGPKGSSQTRYWAELDGEPFSEYSMLLTEWSSYNREMCIRTFLTE